MKRLGERIQKIFNDLERRMKSTDKKEQSGVRGDVIGDVERKQKIKAKK